MLNARLTPGTDLWIPRELDQRAICEPLGRILARHAPIDAGAAGDLSDAAGAVVGVAGYVQFNFARIAQLNAGAAPAQAPAPVTPDPGPHVQPQPEPVAEPVPVTDDGPWSPADAPAAPFHDVFPPPPTGPLG